MFFVLECKHIILIWDIQPLARNFYMAGNQDNSELERPPQLKGDDAAIPAGSDNLSSKVTNNPNVPVPSVKKLFVDMAQKFSVHYIKAEAGRTSPDLNVRDQQRANDFFDSIAKHADFRKCVKVLGGMACVNAEYNTGWIPNSDLKGFSASVTLDIPLGGNGGRKH